MTFYVPRALDVVVKKVLKMSLLKVSVENMEGTERKLHEIDMTKTLEENIHNICELFEKPFSTTVYGLKIKHTNDGKFLDTYISMDNFKDIRDGYFLQLVYSLGYYVNRIFDHISDKYKERSFQDLYELSVDPEFIKEIVKTEKHLKLMDLFTNTELSDTEATACLIAIVHLFQKLYITEITAPFLEKVIYMCKTRSHDELVKYALSVIHKILCHRDENFKKWQEEVLQQINITDLMPFIRKRDVSDLQYGALLLINTMIKRCKGEKRSQLIKEINLKQNREAIYQYIIVTGKMDKNMAHELYIYQTYLLSLFAEPLNSIITVNDSDLFQRNEFELSDSEVKKMTLLMDFDESATKNKSTSIENLLESIDVRISLASVSSKQSEELRLSNRILSTATNESTDYDYLRISILTVEALRHYKKYHYKNFYQSQVEEQVYEPGILASSERVIRMLAKILHVGMEPDRSSTCYQPTIFTCSSKTPFYLELFSRTMWLLSKTRREMKASTMPDYEKVIHVLSKQVRLVLEEKPMDFKSLTEKMVEINYEKVVDKWQKEKKEELKNVLATNPSVQGLKERFAKDNQKVVYEQRMNYIRNGTVFPKFNEKKINGNFRAKLATNGRELLICDFNTVTRVPGEAIAYPLANVTHVVEGKACPHVINNSVKEPQLAFSILINNSDWINFKAADKKMASYWVDAFNLLLGKDGRSDYYKNELNELVEMDLVLHLMELQNVTIPKKPPPIPQMPFEVRPPIPPKPLNYTQSNGNVPS